MKHSSLRPALTMLELIFVIVILGIVSSIGAEIIAQVYESYILQRAQYRANTKTELALTQIANRLRYAIPGTVGMVDSSGFTPITNISAATADALQWVGYDNDSFEAIDSGTASGTTRRPGWSGFCDIDAYASGSKTLPTPGSHLELASAIIGNLDGNISNAQIYFPYEHLALGIAGGSGENITLDSAIPTGTTIYERYKLAWSSYALVVERGDLYLHYNFTPTVGADYSNSPKSLILKNVTNFRFKGSEGSLRIKLCVEEKITSDANISSCKEKVIF